MKPIMILGPTGQVGRHCVDLLKAEELAPVMTLGRRDADCVIDPLDLKALKEAFAEYQPLIVINGIAHTAVDKAEEEQGASMALNTDLPGHLADLCAETGSLLIHYSTDFVFDGSKNTPWGEDDMTNPLSTYGRSKLAGEKAVQISTCPHLILRTSWVFSEQGNNFVKTMLRLAREREELGVVSDQIGSPTYSKDIARATLKLCMRFIKEPEYVRNHSGIYHLTSSGQTSWHGFAEKIFELARVREKLELKNCRAITTNDYPTPAVRPPYSVLNCQKIIDDYGIQMPDWQDALASCLEAYYEEHAGE